MAKKNGSNGTKSLHVLLPENIAKDLEAIRSRMTRNAGIEVTITQATLRTLEKGIQSMRAR